MKADLSWRYERNLLKGEANLPVPITPVEVDDWEAQGLRVDNCVFRPGGLAFSELRTEDEVRKTSALPAFWSVELGAEGRWGKVLALPFCTGETRLELRRKWLRAVPSAFWLSRIE